MGEVAPPLAEGRYRLTDVLGVGGMAVVYRAHDTRLDVSRAIKMLRPELDDRARERFDTEARTMAKLHHPNIVLVHDVAEDGDRAYLVMEYIEGGSIADRLHAYGALPPRMACDVATSVLDGLSAAHQKGIVHRDIKPHNIMVAVDGTVKVTDFGIAQVSDISSTKTGAMIGTWAYMAPEQRADAKHVDGRADVFAMGCTLYKMLTNQEPFDLYNTELHAELFENVPDAFHEVIKQATRYKADNRYSTTLEFKQALDAIRPQLPEDPEDVPPLGASIESERAAFMPTMYAGQDMSQPTLTEQATAEPDQPVMSWGIAAILALAVLFIIGGPLLGVTGVALTGGWMALSGAEDPGVGDPVADPEPVADSQPVPKPMPRPAQVPEPVPKPKPRPAPAERVTLPAPMPRDYQPEPEPSTEGTALVTVNAVPAATVCVDGMRFCSGTPWTQRLELGTYTFDISPLNDPGSVKSIPQRISKDTTICWNFASEARCGAR